MAQAQLTVADEQPAGPGHMSHVTRPSSATCCESHGASAEDGDPDCAPLPPILPYHEGKTVEQSVNRARVLLGMLCRASWVGTCLFPLTGAIFFFPKHNPLAGQVFTSLPADGQNRQVFLFQASFSINISGKTKRTDEI